MCWLGVCPQDIRRHKADKAANCSPTKLWDPATQSFVSKTWVDIQVGDFIMVRRAAETTTIKGAAAKLLDPTTMSSSQALVVITSEPHPHTMTLTDVRT